ncbi:MAG TPA: hypothetical protein VI318_18675 [Baekduia sp.]
MDLAPYVEALHRQLAVAAEAGGEDARALAERLTAPLDAAARLMLLEVLSAAAGEITSELAPGSVDVRLRGGEPELVVVPPPVDDAVDVDSDTRAGAAVPNAAFAPVEDDGGAQARINLRLPDTLKGRVEEAAGRAGLSVNAWLVRAVAAAVEPGGGTTGAADAARRGSQKFTGWVV